MARALESGAKELLLVDHAPGDFGGAHIDPALWSCASLNLLKLSLKGEGGARPLRSLPDTLGRLAGLKTLILSNNALEALPDCFASLPSLKVFEAAFNNLTSLPPSFSKLTNLETLLLAHNKLSSCAPLAGCANLASLTLDANVLTSLDDAKLDAKARH